MLTLLCKHKATEKGSLQKTHKISLFIYSVKHYTYIIQGVTF